MNNIDRNSDPIATDLAEPISEREFEILGRYVNSCYHDGGNPIDGAVWNECNTRSDGAVFGVLCKRDMVGYQRDSDGTTHWVTQKGYDSWFAHKAAKEASATA